MEGKGSTPGSAGCSLPAHARLAPARQRSAKQANARWLLSTTSSFSERVSPGSGIQGAARLRSGRGPPGRWRERENLEHGGELKTAATAPESIQLAKSAKKAGWQRSRSGATHGSA